MKVGFLALATASALAVATPVRAEPRIGAPAPDFTVTTFDGTKISLKSLRGQVVVLNFWAT